MALAVARGEELTPRPTNPPLAWGLHCEALGGNPTTWVAFEPKGP